jgi:uncharacterized OsmC-like protein
MPTISSKYLGELRTEAQHLQSGNTIVTDAPTDNNGRGEAFSPTDLVCAALGSCMMTIMGIVARREGISLEGTRYETTKFMQSEPRKISKIEIAFTFPPLNLSDKHKAMLQNAARTCPVALSLDPNIVQDISFTF